MQPCQALAVVLAHWACRCVAGARAARTAWWNATAQCKCNRLASCHVPVAHQAGPAASCCVRAGLGDWRERSVEELRGRQRRTRVAQPQVKTLDGRHHEQLIMSSWHVHIGRLANYVTWRNWLTHVGTQNLHIESGTNWIKEFPH